MAELRESKKLVDENEEMDFGGTGNEIGQRGTDVGEEEEYVLVPCDFGTSVLTCVEVPSRPLWRNH